MKEYIERKIALDAVKSVPSGNWSNQRYAQEINRVPAADVAEVRHGEWVKVHDEVCYWLACSVCGEEIPKRFGTDYYTNYCPNCGADMRGEQDG